MNPRHHRLSAIASFLAVLVASSLAQAAIVATSSKPFAEPTGFYTGVKSIDVYTDDDIGNPAPGAPGELTYVYTISNDASSFLAIIGFNIDSPIGSVVNAGWVADADPLTPSPSAVINLNNGVVRWDWAAASGLIQPGQTSEQLYIISSYTPGGVNDSVFSIEGDFAFDVQGTCIGPLNQPVPECNLEIVKDGCVVQPTPPPGDECEGKLKCFEFEYTGLGCAGSSNLQDPKKTLCVGGAGGTTPVDIIVTGKKHKKKHGWWGYWNKRKSKKTFASFKDVQVGERHLVCATEGGKHNLGSKTFIAIKNGSNHHDAVEFDKFHTSCSQPFGPGMEFGSLLITSVTSTRGGIVTLPEDPPSEECVTNIDVTPAPHCQGKIRKLVLRYVGGDCTGNGALNSQDPTKWHCSDSAPADTAAVRITVSDGGTESSSTITYVDASPLVIGDLVEIDAASAGRATLSSSTAYSIRNAGDDTLFGDGYFHTSCSQALDLGDQFGPLQVFSISTTEGGTVSLEHEVEYTYEVTNPNLDPLTNVSVDDDKIGNITSGQTIAAGATATFAASALISAETTNVATANGEVNGFACTPATASATIRVTQPPDPDAICTTKVQAMRLRYTGPDVLGARVEIEAKTFPLELVVYDPIDLISGVTELSLASENGFSIDATTHDEIELGSQTLIRVNGVEENLHTSCSTPFESGKAAPLSNPKGDPSPNWFVVDFTQKE